MRINFFVPRCTPDNSHGRYVVELAKRLGVKHQVTLYSGAFWPPLRPVARCRFVPVPIRPEAIRLGMLWTSSVLATKLESADIVHIQGADAPVGNVVTAHCCNSAMRVAAGHTARLHRRFNYAMGAAIEKYCMSKKSTRRIIAVSRKVKAEIEREYGIDPRNVVVIHDGVDLEAFHPRNRARWRAPIRDSLGLGHDEFVVVFVGGEYRLKGLGPLLEAALRISGAVKVLAVGVKRDAALRRLVNQSRVANLVTFVEHSSDMPSLYAAADCFALPTRYDTFSMATLEALASGLPVIISRAAGVSELVRPDRDCIILEDVEDVESLAAHLGRLARDQALRAGLGAEGRKTAERHSWDEVANRTLGVYQDVLMRSGD